MENLGHAIWVWAAMFITLVALPWVVAWRLTPPKSTWQLVLTAFALGCASQAVLGLFWDRLVLSHPLGEVALYVGFWAVLSVLAWFRPQTQEVGIPMSRSESWLLGLILIAAIGIRSVHPLGHAALGQSDAYSHLQFIRQVLADGMIHNQIYPPGYSWIMALPGATFRIDPYWISRFGGALWGAGLSLGIFALGRLTGRQWTGFIAAALTAFCPLWMPLLKTGVGVFANQAGLFFIPLVLLMYLQSDQRKSWWLLLILALALVSTVPMMWISLIPVLLLDRLLAGAARESRWWKKSGWIVLALLPAFALLVWQSSRIQGNHREATMAIVTGGAAPVSSAQDENHSVTEDVQASGPIQLLVQDYFSLKRIGYGSRSLNGMGLGLGIAFAISLILGLQNKNAFMRVLGCWGLITSLQAGTGIMQFSGYQREGWSLLMASAWLGGVLGAGILSRDGRRGWLKSCTLILFIIFLLWACRIPPCHASSFSSAEDELVELIRAVSTADEAGEADRPLTLVVRPFTEFHGNQGNVIHAVTAPSTQIQIMTLHENSSGLDVTTPDRRYLFVMDKIPLTENWTPGFFAQVQPGQVEQYLKDQNRLFQLNDRVKEQAEQFSPELWSREQLPTSDQLEAILIQPAEGRP